MPLFSVISIPNLEELELLEDLGVGILEEGCITTKLVKCIYTWKRRLLNPCNIDTVDFIGVLINRRA